MNQRKSALGAALLSAILLLTACEGSTHYTINEDGTGSLALEMKIDRSELEELEGENMTCEQLAPVFTENDNLPGEVEVEDLGDAETFHCIYTLDTLTYLFDEQLTETAETFIFEIPHSEEFESQMFYQSLRDGDYFYVVEMPGDIISAPGADIDGNTATFTEPLLMAKGIKVEGYKTSNSPSSTPWLAIGLGVALLIAITAGYLVARKKRGSTSPNGPGEYNGQQPNPPMPPNDSQESAR